MNTNLKTPATARIASLAVAALMTLAMLGSVDRLATPQPHAGWVVQTTALAAHG